MKAVSWRISLRARACTRFLARSLRRASGDVPPYRHIAQSPYWLLPPQAAGQNTRGAARTQKDVPPMHMTTPRLSRTFRIHAVCTGLALLVSRLPAWQFTDDAAVHWTASAAQSAATNTLAGTAAMLAETLARMTGRTVPVVAGAAADAAGILLELRDPGAAPTAAIVFSGRLEAYELVPHGNMLHIAGPTAMAVRHGVFDLLHRQGCRWLLPSPRWWIVPSVARPSLEGAVSGAPAFAYRRIWYAYGAASPEWTRFYQHWCEANRLGGAAQFQTGHSYLNIIGRQPAAFAAHPEYYALNPPPDTPPPATVDPVDTLLEEAVAAPVPPALVDPIQPAAATRSTSKFCYANPGLRALCLDDRLALLQANRRANPLAFMVSMDPSDGTGTCHCPDCLKLGSTTDRVVSLANHVARGLRAVDPDAWVGMYAYSSHREPPAIPVEPNIHVQVAMAFNKGPHSYEELIRLWGEKAGSLGIREYYGVEAWDFGLPGRIRGASPDYHAKWIPRYHAAGAVSLSAESNDNWGPQALGFYTAARLLWDPAADPAAIRDEFLTAAFGKAARGPMTALYAEFAKNQPLTPINLLRLYDLADQGLRATTVPGGRERVIDLLAYLDYVVRFARFEALAAHTEPYYAALQDLMSYAHRIQPRGMVAVYALARRLCNANVKGKRDDLWLFGDDPVWRRGEPHADEEILALAEVRRAELRQAVAERPVFSRDLMPVAGLPAPRHPSMRTLPFRYRASGLLVPRASRPYPFVVGPNVSMTLAREDAEPASEPIILTVAASAPARTNQIELVAGARYRLTLQTGKTTGTVVLPEGVAVALEASPEQPLWLDSGVVFNVFVPAATTELRSTGDPRLSLLDPGNQRYDVSVAEPGKDYTAIAVRDGHAGCFWAVGNQTRGRIAFHNIPPWVQLDTEHALLPPDTPSTGDTTR